MRSPTSACTPLSGPVKIWRCAPGLGRRCSGPARWEKLVPRSSSTSPSARSAVLRHCRSHRAENAATAKQEQGEADQEEAGQREIGRMRSGGSAFDKVRPSMTTGAGSAVDPVWWIRCGGFHLNARAACRGPGLVATANDTRRQDQPSTCRSSSITSVDSSTRRRSCPAPAPS